MSAKNKKQGQSTYVKKFSQWFDSLPKEEREGLANAGITKPITRPASVSRRERVKSPDSEGSRKLDAKGAAFEAAQPSLNRGLVWVPTTDPKRELTAYTRMEILRLSRWLYNNAPQGTYLVEHLA